MNISVMNVATLQPEPVADGSVVYVTTSSGERYQLAESEDGLTITLAMSNLVVAPRTANSVALRPEMDPLTAAYLRTATQLPGEVDAATDTAVDLLDAAGYHSPDAPDQLGDEISDAAQTALMIALMLLPEKNRGQLWVAACHRPEPPAAAGGQAAASAEAEA